MILFLLPPDPLESCWVFQHCDSGSCFQRQSYNSYKCSVIIICGFRGPPSLPHSHVFLVVGLSPSQGCPCPSRAAVTLRRACAATPRTNGGTPGTGSGGGGPPPPPTPAPEETTPRDWVNNTPPSPQIYRTV